MTADSITAASTDRELDRLASTDEERQELEQRRRRLRAVGTVRAAEALIDMLTVQRTPAELDLMAEVAEAMLHHPLPGLREKLADFTRQQVQHPSTDIVTHLTTMLADAEAREDPVDAAWARHSLGVATKVSTQMDAVEALILALIPKQERGALTALVIEEQMPRITAAVNAAVAQAKTVADELTSEADRG
ncbi:hypothetical protein [Tsukamurella tyrosinosolvens]|uniref:hypothetical protein n=1 Tax=Tsukamurella tyrosinosolvens TaxID=57704 RepID=UPI000C7ED3AA|nr:hypothetical protein [Tsukamurella tyrosinosolvens]AUN38664.1 hypothetical protein ASU32_00440 [Tsukamurella tyrosinosolvens]